MANAIAAGCVTVLLQGALAILMPEAGEGRIDAPLLALAATFAGCGLGFGRIFARGGGLAGSLGGGAALESIRVEPPLNCRLCDLELIVGTAIDHVAKV